MPNWHIKFGGAWRASNGALCHTTDFAKLGRILVLKARMNADLHMSEVLKNTGKGNLFIVFGEPTFQCYRRRTGRSGSR